MIDCGLTTACSGRASPAADAERLGAVIEIVRRDLEMSIIRLFSVLALLTSSAYPQEWVMNCIPDSSKSGGALPSDFIQRIEHEVGRSFNTQVPTLMFRNVYSGVQDSLTSLRGKVVLLNIWSSGCSPCIEEMPTLLAVQSELAARGFVLFTLSAEDTAKQKQFFAQRKLIHAGVVGSMRIQDYEYPFQYLINPAGYIIDREGILRDFWLGPKTQDELVEKINRYL
jgi:thiol-disulfide isomerase/thioredoxin